MLRGQKKVTGLPTMLLVSADFQAAVGLNKLNRTLLATVAQWQEDLRLPILMGATSTSNLKPCMPRIFSLERGWWSWPQRQPPTEPPSRPT